MWVYKLSEDIWQEKAYLKAAVPLQQQRFGAALALSDDGSTLAVGAPGESIAIQDDVGAVYLFRSGDLGDTWLPVQQLASPLIEADTRFGRALSISESGETLAAGNFDGSAGTGVGISTGSDAAYSGAVHLYRLAAGSWTHRNMVKASNTDSGDYFGWSLALSADGESLALSADGESLAVGAPGEDSGVGGIGADQASNDADDTGAVYLY